MSFSTPVLSADSTQPLLVTTLEAASLRLAIPLHNTLEVRQAEKLVKPAVLAPFQVGLLVLRGHVLPTFNLSAYLRGTCTPGEPEPALYMVVYAEGRTLVLGVDAVLGVEEIAPSRLQPQPTGGASWLPQLISAPDADQLVQLVDVQALAELLGVSPRKN